MANEMRYERDIEFYATSPRLVDAYCLAARHSRSLARMARIRDLADVIASRKPIKQGGEAEIVVLSHAEDDSSLLTDKRAEAITSEAFFLLFTVPSTHPDQIAHWMRTARISSENRLHAVQVDSLESPTVGQLLNRVCRALGGDARDCIIDAYLARGILLIRGPGRRILHVPVSSIAALRDVPVDVLRNFEVDADGSFIYWPIIDVHLGWNQFLQAVNPEEHRKAQQRSQEFNKRYGFAIRQLREAAGVPQSRIRGLTERQLRRIEQGECRATARAIQAIARAHKLSANEYMDRIAQAMAKHPVAYT